MAIKSEQINSNGEIVLDYCQYNTGKKIFDPLINALGNSSKVTKRESNPHNKYIEFEHNGINKAILLKSVTYLGHPHPLYKKRIQISNWFKDFYDKEYSNFDEIKLMGVYLYNDNRLFVEFDIEDYMNRRAHNSSAHVYSIDFIKAIEDGIFRKIDKNNNVITVVREDKIKQYIEESLPEEPTLLNKITSFTEYVPKDYISSIDAIKQMRLEESSNWRQTEWSGWYLEHEFEKFLKENNLQEVISFSTVDRGNNLDLYFPKNEFYADLKAHSSDSNSILGNDWEIIQEKIDKHGKVWYLVMKHETIKDKDGEATKQRTDYMNYIDNTTKTIPRRKIKKAIKFEELIVVEINKWNLHLIDFFQEGMANSDGRPRNKKIQVKKKHLDNDNLVIARKKV